MIILPADAQARVNAALGIGRLARAGPVLSPPNSPRCANCNDAGLVVVQIENPEERSQTWWDDVRGWVRIDTLAPPCPVCKSQADLIRHLWADCGLEEHERGWRVSYLSGRDGKEEALEAGVSILALTPAPAGWVTLYGDYGRGKTGLLKSLVAQLITAGVPAIYRRAGDVLADIQATFGERSEVTQAGIERVIGRARFLALDEVDRTSDRSWSRATLFRLLDLRYSRRATQATVLATNTPPDQLPDDLKYLASRMTDGQMIAVGGDDLRGKP